MDFWYIEKYENERAEKKVNKFNKNENMIRGKMYEEDI